MAKGKDHIQQTYERANLRPVMANAKKLPIATGSGYVQIVKPEGYIHIGVKNGKHSGIDWSGLFRDRNNEETLKAVIGVLEGVVEFLKTQQ